MNSYVKLIRIDEVSLKVSYFSSPVNSSRCSNYVSYCRLPNKENFLSSRYETDGKSVHKSVHGYIFHELPFQALLHALL